MHTLLQELTTCSSRRALNCFSPNINLIRDPRWGRASETYGEDPHLTSELVKAYVTGLQGNDSRYVKVTYSAYSQFEQCQNVAGYLTR